MTELAVMTRVALTVALLLEVWHHAHWSVALALTLSCAWAELLAYQQRKRAK